MAVIAPDPILVDAFVRTRRRTAAALAVVIVPAVVGVLILEYRVMILCVLPLVLPLVSFLQGREVRRRVGIGGAIGVAPGSNGLEVRIVRAGAAPAPYREAAGEVVVLPYATISAASVLPDAIVLVRALGPARFERFIVPGPRPNVEAVGALLATRGTKVTHDSLGRLAGFFVGVVLAKGLVVVALALVAGALAYGFRHELPIAAAMIAGALCALVGAALLRGLVAPKG